MGSLHIILGDRFNQELKEIYQKAFLYILFHLGRVFDGQRLNESEYSTINIDSKLIPNISNKLSDEKNEAKSDKGKEEEHQNVKKESTKNEKNIEEEFTNLSLYASKYKDL